MTEIGHNSGLDQTAQERVKAYVERIERLEDEKSMIVVDIREIYKEAKSAGFDSKIIRKVVSRRKMDAEKRAEQDSLLELYEGVFA